MDEKNGGSFVGLSPVRKNGIRTKEESREIRKRELKKKRFSKETRMFSVVGGRGGEMKGREMMGRGMKRRGMKGRGMKGQEE